MRSRPGSAVDGDRAEPRDTLVILGDVVDRGPDSRRCIDILLNLQDHCQLVVIQGNHEEMLLSALSGGEWVRDWMHYGGRETLESYGGFDSIPEDHLEFMRNGLNLHVTETEIFVHAGIDPLLPLDRQPASALRWERFAPWQGAPPEGKRVVCGHTVQPGGVPYVIERWVCIDTGVYLDKGRLTAHRCHQRLGLSVQSVRYAAARRALGRDRGDVLALLLFVLRNRRRPIPRVPAGSRPSDRGCVNRHSGRHQRLHQAPQSGCGRHPVCRWRPDKNPPDRSCPS